VRCEAVSIHVHVRTASPEDIERWLQEDVQISELPSVRELALGRDWDALHFLLTGSVSVGRGPAAFLKSGGRFVQRGGNDRLFRPFLVRRIHAALTALPMPLIRRRFNPQKMEKAEVYRGSWDHDPPHEGELFDLVKELKALVRGGQRPGGLAHLRGRRLTARHHGPPRR
jgi:hypothetical protein